MTETTALANFRKNLESLETDIRRQAMLAAKYEADLLNAKENIARMQRLKVRYEDAIREAEAKERAEYRATVDSALAMADRVLAEEPVADRPADRDHEEPLEVVSTDRWVEEG